LGGSQESGHRAGTENVALIVGMAVALQENIDSLQENIIHIQDLEEQLLHGLEKKDIAFHRNGSPNHIVGNISLSFPDEDGEAILHKMDLMGINVSTGSACDSKETQISHVLKAIHLKDKFAKGTIRVSLGRMNTVEDIDKIVSCMNKIIGKH
jgi:cysteine desulfurase